jgi:hypothetical protein
VLSLEAAPCFEIFTGLGEGKEEHRGFGTCSSAVLELPANLWKHLGWNYVNQNNGRGSR